MQRLIHATNRFEVPSCAGSKRLDGEQESRTKGAPARSPANGGVAQVASASEGLQPQEEPPPLLPPTPLPTGKTVPRLSEASRLLREEDLAALTAALPGLHRLSPWRLLYSTWRDGISLSTLYRCAFSPHQSGTGGTGTAARGPLRALSSRRKACTGSCRRSLPRGSGPDVV